jgi:PPK2 family polyphosphate:nucleotide phosphotransferase
MNYGTRFQVRPGSTLHLAAIDPAFGDPKESKKSAERKIRKYADRLRALQYLVYAEGKRSVLICLQGLDAAGKDGTINHVLGAMNPQGTRVHGFKVPSAEEASHDFLWRVHRQTPAIGEVVVFNRCHYEDVLVVRVHDLVPKEVWSRRYDLINDFERNLVAAGTHILKFYLHISEAEQLERFKKRIDVQARRWKISEADYTERTLWPRYIRAYEDAISKTSTPHAPWYVIPADHKWFRNLAISRIVVESLEALGMKLPQPRVDLQQIRRKYHAAAKS